MIVYDQFKNTTCFNCSINNSLKLAAALVYINSNRSGRRLLSLVKY